VKPLEYSERLTVTLWICLYHTPLQKQVGEAFLQSPRPATHIQKLPPQDDIEMWRIELWAYRESFFIPCPRPVT
jgi:hypothetical protein